MSSEEYAIQRILRDLCEREVIYNVNYLICELAKISGQIPYDKDSDINDEMIRELMTASATYLEAVENDGNYVIVEHDGEYHWYEAGDPIPFKDIPKDYKLKRRVKRVYNPGWGWQHCTSDVDDDWHGYFDTKAEAIEDAWVNGVGLEAFDTAEDAAENCCDENAIDRQDYDHEVYEHYIVTEHFGRKLKEHGEQVVEFCNMTIWCRCCTGQSIYMDGVIESVARSMEILPGMKYAWSNKD